MEKYIYYCPKCGIVGSAYHAYANEYQECTECKGSMIYTGITKADWDKKSEKDKDVLREHFKKMGKNSSLMKYGLDNDALLNILRRQTEEIVRIKNILLIYLFASFLFVIFIISYIE